MKSSLTRLPAGIWALGLTSLCMDTSSELIHSLLPLFMVSSLGASTLAVGVIEGIAEAIALVTKVFSGFLSDYWRKRKGLALVGYGLAALTKPMFPLAASLAWIMTARFVDRIGKGIRGAPRDALIADITPAPIRGTAYGLRQALDTVGAVAGPVLAIIFMSALADNFRLVFWIAVAPAIAAVILLTFGVHEPTTQARDGNVRPPIHFRDAQRLPALYWLVVLVGGVLTLARFSEAFLVLRAQSVGIATAWIPLVMVVMSIVYAVAAYPAGVLADQGRRSTLLRAGLLALVAADIVLANAASAWVVMLGAALWGLHMGLTQGLLATLVADAAPAELRGTAFGLFNLVSGGALLIASTLAGWLWQAHGPAFTFYAGALFSALALAGLVGLHGKRDFGGAA